MGMGALAIVSLAITAVGTGVSAYSSYQSGKAQQRINEYNAKVNEQDAANRERDGRMLANAQRARSQKILATQRTLYAKGGVVGETGSPLMVMAEQAGQLEMAALDVGRTANAEAGRLKTQAVLDRMSGKAARQAGTLNAVGTVLSGAGSVGMGYANFKKTG